MSILQPILPLYLTSIGVAPTVLGLMFSVSMVGIAIGEGFWGWLADRVGLKIPLSVGTFACAVILLGFVLTQSTPAIFLTFLFWGVVRAAVFPIGRGYVGATAPLARKATFMAIYAAIMAACRSLGSLTSGCVAGAWGYHSAFFISCGIALLGGILVVSGLGKVQLPKAKPAPASTSDSPSSEATYSYGPIALQCTVAALHSFETGISMAFLPLLATQVLGANVVEVGILFTIQGLVTMVLLLPMGMLADRMGQRLLMIIGLLVSALSLIGVAFAPSFAWLIFFIVIRTLGMALFYPAAVALLSNSMALHRQSTAMGVYGVSEDIGAMIGSTLGGFVWSALGPRPTFLTGAISGALAAVVCIAWVREAQNHK